MSELVAALLLAGKKADEASRLLAIFAAKDSIRLASHKLETEHLPSTVNVSCSASGSCARISIAGRPSDAQ